MTYKDLTSEQKILIDQLINIIDWDKNYQNTIELIINGPKLSMSSTSFDEMQEAIHQGIMEGFKCAKLNLLATF